MKSNLFRYTYSVYYRAEDHSIRGAEVKLSFMQNDFQSAEDECKRIMQEIGLNDYTLMEIEEVDVTL